MEKEKRRESNLVCHTFLCSESNKNAGKEEGRVNLSLLEVLVLCGYAGPLNLLNILHHLSGTTFLVGSKE